MAPKPRNVLLASHAADEHDARDGTYVFRLNETLSNCTYLRLVLADLTFERPLLHPGNTAFDYRYALPAFQLRGDGTVALAPNPRAPPPTRVDFSAAAVDDAAVAAQDASAMGAAFRAIQEEVNAAIAPASGSQLDFESTGPDGGRLARFRASPGVGATDKRVPSVSFSSSARYVLGFPPGGAEEHTGVSFTHATAPLADITLAASQGEADQFTVSLGPSRRAFAAEVAALLPQGGARVYLACTPAGGLYFDLVSADPVASSLTVADPADGAGSPVAPAVPSGHAAVVVYRATDLVGPRPARLAPTDYVALRVAGIDRLEDACRPRPLGGAFALVDRRAPPYAAVSHAPRVAEHAFDPVLPGLRELRVQVVDPYGEPYHLTNTFFRLEFQVGLA